MGGEQLQIGRRCTPLTALKVRVSSVDSGIDNVGASVGTSAIIVVIAGAALGPVANAAQSPGSTRLGHIGTINKVAVTLAELSDFPVLDIGILLDVVDLVSG
jgi:hypothetical protein